MQSRLTLTTLTVALATCLVCTEVIVAQGGKEITNSIGMKLVLIPKGTFQMGSPETEDDRGDDETQHEVTISRDYYLGVTEVTQGQYEKVMGTNPSFHQKQVIFDRDSSMYPVEQVGWEDAVEFCKKLSELPEEKQAGRVYRLPTEAEWEYACRAGSKTAFSFGDNSGDLAGYAVWFGNNSGIDALTSYAFWARFKDTPQEDVDTLLSTAPATRPVGEKKANAWGLYDMHGNVWELCSDWYGEYPKVAVSDPAGPPQGSLRVRRGGSWYFDAAFCRSASRGRCEPSIGSIILSLGFRVALSSPGIPK